VNVASVIGKYVPRTLSVTKNNRTVIGHINGVHHILGCRPKNRGQTVRSDEKKNETSININGNNPNRLPFAAQQRRFKAAGG